MTVIFVLSTDIQEFYELTLLDESKSIQQKTAETLLIASKWELENNKIEVTFIVVTFSRLTLDSLSGTCDKFVCRFR